MSENLGGTIRACSAEQTLQNIKPFIKLAGITRIANLTDLDCLGLPVYTCFRPESKNLATSQGKGVTHNLAKCSAYMEGIEHYFSENVPIDIECHIKKLNPATTIAFGKLPKGLIDGKNLSKHVTKWHIGKSIITDAEFYIPTNYISFNLDSPCFENGIFKKTTTGLASGNTYDEAINHALYETIERNCLAEFERMPHPEKIKRLIDINTIDYSHANKLIAKCHEHKVDVVIFDLTNKFNIPTYHVIIADENPFRKLGHYSGSGTHLNRGIALCRALTEAAQSRLTYISGSRDDMFPEDYNMVWQPLKLNGTESFTKRHSFEIYEIDQQLSTILEILTKNNYDVIVFEHTDRSLPIAVVKVVIPGLQI